MKFISIKKHNGQVLYDYIWRKKTVSRNLDSFGFLYLNGDSDPSIL